MEYRRKPIKSQLKSQTDPLPRHFALMPRLLREPVERQLRVAVAEEAGAMKLAVLFLESYVAGMLGDDDRGRSKNL